MSAVCVWPLDVEVLPDEELLDVEVLPDEELFDVDVMVEPDCSAFPDCPVESEPLAVPDTSSDDVPPDEEVGAGTTVGAWPPAGVLSA